jgi:PAS domain S-box-containing protein
MTAKDTNKPLQQQIAETQYRTRFSGEQESKSTINAVERIFQTETYRLLVGAMKEGVAVLSETGKIVYCNDSFAQILKSASDRIIGFELEAIVQADYAQTLKQLITKAENQNSEVLFLKDEANNFTAVNASANRIEFDNCTISFLVLTNLSAYISGHLQQYNTMLEYALANRSMFSDVFNGTNTRIAVRDKQGKLVIVNNAEAAFLKKTVREVIGRTPHELYTKDKADQVVMQDKIVLTTDQPLQLEEEIIVDGSPRALLKSRYPLKNERGETYGVSIVTVDITENKKLERQLRESEKSFQDIFENTVFGIALMDSEMKLFRTNKTFTQITGYIKEELTSVSKFTYAIDVKTEYFLVKQVLKGEQEKYSLEKRAICKDGSIKWIKVTGLPTLNEKGKFQYFVITIEDVTDHKLMENKLSRYRASLEQLVEERTKQLLSARRSAIIGQAAGLVGQQILLKYIFRDEQTGTS